MSDAKAILSRARSMGLSLSVEGNRIAIAPARLCSPDLLAEFREHKPALLALLEGQAANANPAVRAQASLADHQDRFIRDLCEYVRFPSVSAQPAHRADLLACAQWLARHCEQVGLEVRLVTTAGHPVVVAKTPRRPGRRPHYVVYGHYDVQPPDPLELWETPPFEPRLVGADGNRRIVARGVADDKGQLMTFVEACRAFIAAEGKLPLPVTILLEGEEETGSPSLPPFLDAHKQELAADVEVRKLYLGEGFRLE